MCERRTEGLLFVWLAYISVSQGCYIKKKNLVLLASLLSLPIPPRQASDVKGSEVIA